MIVIWFEALYRLLCGLEEGTFLLWIPILRGDGKLSLRGRNTSLNHGDVLRLLRLLIVDHLNVLGT